MPLSEQQQASLEQLWAVTASDTTAARERDERLLRENGWDVQRTVEQIFTMEPSGSSSTSATPSAGPSRSRGTMEAFEVDDSQVDDSPPAPRPPPGARRLSGTGPGRARRRSSTPGYGTGSAGLGVFGVIGWPVRVLWGVLSGTWYFFIRTFIPLSFLPHLPRFLLPPTSPQTRTSSTAPQDPTASALAFIRDLELFTGCSARTATMPEFYIGPYREFMTDVRKQGKIGLVILVCGEHEDDEEFKRDVLCDPEFVRIVREKEIMVWGADIRSREGYQVSQTLLTTTYPALTFVSLLPNPGYSPRLTILTTLSGPPSTTTSTSTLIQTITTSILPRTSAFLNRLKRERLTLEESRHLREEQDKAFRQAEAADREKTRVAKEAEQLERIKAERAEREAREKEENYEKLKIWRRYARKHLLPPSSGPIRIALRTPLSSERNIRNFTIPADGSTLPLFIFAETLLIPPSDTSDSDPDSPPVGFIPPWNFRIVTNYPRKEIELVDDQAMADGGQVVWEEVKKAGGALFVESKEGAKWGERERREINGDDGSSDEEVEGE